MSILITLLEAAAKIIGASREAFAAKLEQVAKDIRAGKLIPDEAFERAKEDAELLDNLYGKFSDKDQK